jgi:hypothetical protein
MSRWYWQSGSLRRVSSLAVALAAIGQFPAVATADSLDPDGPLFALDLAWAAALAPVPSVPGDASESPALPGFDDVSNPRNTLAGSSPGLQFALDPDSEEIFIGWRVEF